MRARLTQPGKHRSGRTTTARSTRTPSSRSPMPKIYVKNIADAFCTADAAGCDAYKANADAYTGKLDALEAEVKAAVASIPADKRTIITSHDAFGYFQHEYGIDLPGARRHIDRCRSFGRRRRKADRADQARQGIGDLRREHHQPAPDRADRQRDGPEDRRHALFGCAVGCGRAGGHLYRHDEEQHRRDKRCYPRQLDRRSRGMTA